MLDVATPTPAIVRVVETTERSSPLPIEGAVGYVRVGATQKQLRSRRAVVRVAAGRTTIRSWVRICNGNCGFLSEPSDRCAITVTLPPGTVTVTIHRHFGRPCRLTLRR